MRQVTSTDNVPAAVYRYLLPYERQTTSMRTHPAVLIGPTLLVFVGLSFAGWLSNAFSPNATALLVIWFTWALLVLYLLGRVLRWLAEYYVVTSERILLVKGYFATDVAMMPLAWVADMRLRRSTTGRLFGYGQLIFELRGQDRALRSLKFVPYPEPIYLEICGLIFPDAARRPEDEQD
jgi:uncharacterized membrane protein YdbT with pleckstrin-like domain